MACSLARPVDGQGTERALCVGDAAAAAAAAVVVGGATDATTVANPGVFDLERPAVSTDKTSMKVETSRSRVIVMAQLYRPALLSLRHNRKGPKVDMTRSSSLSSE